MTGKRCSKCRTWYEDAVANFIRNQRIKCGFNSWCKSCCRRYQQNRNLLKPKSQWWVEYRAKKRAECEANGLTCTRCKVRYEYANLAAVFRASPVYVSGYHSWCNPCMRRYETENRKAINARQRRAHAKHREARLARQRQRRQDLRATNPEVLRVKWRNTRARDKGMPGVHTVEDVLRLLESQAGRCFWCDAQLEGHEYTVDHVLPYRHSGTNAADNLVVSCAFCNRSKGSLHPAVFNTERWERFRRGRGLS